MNIPVYSYFTWGLCMREKPYECPVSKQDAHTISHPTSCHLASNQPSLCKLLSPWIMSLIACIFFLFRIITIISAQSLKPKVYIIFWDYLRILNRIIVSTPLFRETYFFEKIGMRERLKNWGRPKRGGFL